MDCISFIATSVDGFIARPDGGLDWLEVDLGEEDCGFKDFLNSVQALVMGRNTYEKILEIGQWVYGDLPVYVLSKSLDQKSVPEHLADKVTITNKSPSEIVRHLSQKGMKRAYIDGGKLVQGFIRAGLLDEIIITRIPVLLGAGIPLFGETSGDVQLHHIETKTFVAGFVQSHYKVVSN